MQLPAFDGAIFDLDGTLLDSMYVWKQIDIDFLAEQNLAVPDDYLHAVNGMSMQQAAAYTRRRFALSLSEDDLLQSWTRMAKREYHTRVPLKPGVAAYVHALHEKGVRCAIATASETDLYEPALARTGILDCFDAHVLLREVARGKRFPDIYLLAARRLGLPPGRCVVFEDIYDGICGARDGGFFTCAVEDEASAPMQAQIQAAAHAYIHSFCELLQT